MNRNDLYNIEQLYLEIIEEGKRGHGDMEAVLELMKQGYHEGLYKIQETSSGWRLLSNINRDIETIHKGERAFHYLRRFINKLREIKKYG
jgi:hypothetical protein